MESQKEIRGHEEQLPAKIKVEIKVNVDVDVEKGSASISSDERNQRSRTPGTWRKQLSEKMK